MSVSQFFQQLQDLQNYEARMTQTLPADDETFTVEFHVDSGSPCLENLDYKITASREDSGAVVVIVPEVDSTLIVSLNDDELAEFFGIDSENLIYTDRGVL
jgi:hypothetical protein